jgi:hypothetical protein
MSATLKTVSQSFKNVGNVFKNDNLTNFVLFLTIALSVGYLVNKTYHAIVLLYVIAALMFLLCKNVACALGISIILTNLFLALKLVPVKENFEPKQKRIKNPHSDKKKEKKEKKD